MIAAVTTMRPTAAGLSVPWVVVRADAVRLMLPIKAASGYHHVCGSRYADDMQRLVASSSGLGASWSGSVARSVGPIVAVQRSAIAAAQDRRPRSTGWHRRHPGCLGALLVDAAATAV